MTKDQKAAKLIDIALLRCDQSQGYYPDRFYWYYAIAQKLIAYRLTLIK